MNEAEKPIAELTKEAIAILIRELGVVSTMRLFRHYNVPIGEYADQREELFGHLSFEEIIEASKAFNLNQNSVR